MNPSIFLALASIHLAAVITPGANFLRVTQNALAYSRRAGLLTVMGVATGSFLYVTAGIVGFAAIISQSPIAYNLIRIIGAAYFVYMGVQLLRRKPRLSADSTIQEFTADRTRAQAYRDGLFTALSNPAAALYFLSVFTTIIPASSAVTEKVAAGLMLVTITLLWYTLVAITCFNPRVRALYRTAEGWINRVFGVLWLLLAVRLLAA